MQDIEARLAVLKEKFGTLGDVHKEKASKVFDVPVAEVTPAQRKLCKTINFLSMYGKI